MSRTAEVQSILDSQKKTWDRFAPGWNKWDGFFMRSIAPMGEALLGAADLKPGWMVLDVATGTGEPGLTAAERVRPGEVLGIDISEAMIRIARENAARRDMANFKGEALEASSLPHRDGHFDAILCRLGIMFFGDVNGTLSELCRVLKQGGKAAFSSWAEPAANPWASLTGSIVSRMLAFPAPPVDAPGIYRFAEPEKLRSTLLAAGFRKVEVSEVKGEIRFASAQEYWEFMTDVVAPIVKALQEAAPEKRLEVQEAVLKEADKRISGEGLVFPWKAWTSLAMK